MRWKDKSPRSGFDNQVVLKFLWFPRRFDGEVRWFEWAYIKEEAVLCVDMLNGPYLEWKETGFATEKEYQACLHG